MPSQDSHTSNTGSGETERVDGPGGQALQAQTALLEAANVCYEYPNKRALDGVSFALHRSSVTALVGPNGSGKTTLLRCLAALDSPYSGRVSVGGNDSSQDPRACHALIGYLSDSFGLYDNLLVSQCLLHQGAIHGFRGQTLQRAVDHSVERLGIGSLLTQRAGNLSRGQRQRVGVALALLHSPKILLLDEPASGLDPEARSELAGLFRSLRDDGLCILVSSHILAELEDYSDRMLTLRDGRILGDERVGIAQEKSTLTIRIEVLGEPDALYWTLGASPRVSELEREKSGAVFRFEGGSTEQAELLKNLINGGIAVTEFASARVSLEKVYLRQIEEKKK